MQVYCTLYSQNKGDVINKIFDSKKHQKRGDLPFFPAVRRHFGDFCFVLQKEILIICEMTKTDMINTENF